MNFLLKDSKRLPFQMIYIFFISFLYLLIIVEKLLQIPHHESGRNRSQEDCEGRSGCCSPAGSGWSSFWQWWREGRLGLERDQTHTDGRSTFTWAQRQRSRVTFNHYASCYLFMFNWISSHVGLHIILEWLHIERTEGLHPHRIGSERPCWTGKGWHEKKVTSWQKDSSQKRFSHWGRFARRSPQARQRDWASWNSSKLDRISQRFVNLFFQSIEILFL